jgi:hypothetical protein
MSLAEMQRVFWRAVRFDPAPPQVDDVFVSRGRLSARDRLALYRRMYWFRQVDALYETFPILADRLGEQAFSKLASAFIAVSPSEHHALEHLGERLPAFMRGRGNELIAADAAVWADLAELEWAQCAALLAPDPEAVATLADLPLDRFAFVRLEFVPSLVVCSVTPAALAILRQLDRAQSELPAEQGSEPQTTLVWRPHFHARDRALAADEAEALSRARLGATLDEVCLAFADTKSPTERAALVITRWIADALVVRARVEGDES